MKYEFIVVMENNESFCDTKESFNNFLQSDSSIEIKDKKLKYKIKDIINEFDYYIESKNIEDKNQRYFHLAIEISNDKREECASLVRKIKQILSCLNSKKVSINTLWDDISRFYSIEVYPLFNEIENLMRKLITKFMITKLGIEWFDAMPKNIKEQVTRKIKRNESQINSDLEKNKFQPFEDILSNADFIGLSYFLFNKYRVKDLGQLDILLSKNLDEKKIIEVLKNDFALKSNWERFFSGLIDFKGDLLEKKWEELYNLRNIIAHNNRLSKEDYQNILDLVPDIKNKLEAAIKVIDKVLIEDKDKSIFSNIWFDYINLVDEKFFDTIINSNLDFFKLIDFYSINKPTNNILSFHDKYKTFLNCNRYFVDFIESKNKNSKQDNIENSSIEESNLMKPEIIEKDIEKPDTKNDKQNE